jgi:hypothetical protein
MLESSEVCSPYSVCAPKASWVSDVVLCGAVGAAFGSSSLSGTAPTCRAGKRSRLTVYSQHMHVFM